MPNRKSKPIRGVFMGNLELMRALVYVRYPYDRSRTRFGAFEMMNSDHNQCSTTYDVHALVYRILETCRTVYVRKYKCLNVN